MASAATTIGAGFWRSELRSESPISTKSALIVAEAGDKALLHQAPEGFTLCAVRDRHRQVDNASARDRHPIGNGQAREAGRPIRRNQLIRKDLMVRKKGTGPLFFLVFICPFLRVSCLKQKPNLS